MGFEHMDKARLKEICAKGGRTGGRHEFTPEEARAAGQKGGRATSADREHMAAIGRKGGRAATAKYGTRFLGHGGDRG